LLDGQSTLPNDPEEFGRNIDQRKVTANHFAAFADEQPVQRLGRSWRRTLLPDREAELAGTRA
jgi:hypothetical protein